jgi:hypothetical protein
MLSSIRFPEIERLSIKNRSCLSGKPLDRHSARFIQQGKREIALLNHLGGYLKILDPLVTG